MTKTQHTLCILNYFKKLGKVISSGITDNLLIIFVSEEIIFIVPISR